MRSITAALVLIGAMAAPVAAQGRGGWPQGRIPPGQMPPAGSCRVWYDGVPPGQQPPPMSCRDAERIASRSRDARVVYGDQGRYRQPARRSRSLRQPLPRPVRAALPVGNARYGVMTCRIRTAIATGWRRVARTRAIAIRSIRSATAATAAPITATTGATGRRTSTGWSTVTASRRDIARPTATTGPIGATAAEGIRSGRVQR